MAFSPDARTLVTGNRAGAVMLWDVSTGKQRLLLKRHKRDVNFVGFAPDGKTLYSQGDDRQLIYWDPATGEERRVIDLKKQKVVWTKRAALSPDGSTLAIMVLATSACSIWRPASSGLGSTGTTRAVRTNASPSPRTANCWLRGRAATRPTTRSTSTKSPNARSNLATEHEGNTLDTRTPTREGSLPVTA